MKGPKSMDSPLQHRPSAKALISRFESMSSVQSIPDSPLRLSTPSRPQSLSIAHQSSPPVKKDKSPVRQSFRNIISLFKKSNAKPKATETVPEENDLSGPLVGAVSNTEMSGTLLYLLKSSITPVWTNCTAELHGDTMVLTWLTPYEDPDQRIISLAHCIDVRSLPVNQLDVDEKAILPQGQGELCLFEILLDGSKVRFGSLSVRDRAQWVSSIWDAILPSSREDRAVANMEIPCDYPLPNERPLPQTPIRFLPQPTEIPKNSLVIEVSTPRLKPASSYPKSTSIANLGQRSMVRQRLAQMESQSANSVVSSSLFSHQSTLQSAYTNISVDTHQRSTKPLPRVSLPSVSSNDISNSMTYDYTQPTQRVPIDQHTTLSCAPTADIGTVLEVLQDHATKHLDQTTNLGEQLLALQQDVQTLSSQDQRSVVASIRQSLAQLDSRTDGNSMALKSIRAKLEQMSESTRSSGLNSSEGNQIYTLDNVKPETKDPEVIAKSLDKLHSRLDSDLPYIRTLIEANSKNNDSSATLFDATLLDTKLQEIVQTSQEPQFAHILAAIKEENEHRITQYQQQGDCVRYLNELNIWLEAFVNNGTSQIQSMAASVDRLRDEIGMGNDVQGQSGNGLFADIRKLVEETKARDESNNNIHMAINELLGNDSQGVYALLLRQHQQHEALMMNLSTELKNEIRGERLRFVEAMKEATAINVQMHVDDFKSELKHEVRGITAEVGQLYQQRQDMENSIAELFSFYSKQKSPPKRLSIPHPIPVDNQPYGRMPTPAPDNKRPLPSPRRHRTAY